MLGGCGFRHLLILTTLSYAPQATIGQLGGLELICCVSTEGSPQVHTLAL